MQQRTNDPVTDPVLEEPFTSILQALTTLLDASPCFEHAVHLLPHFVQSFEQYVCGTQVFRNHGHMRPEVGFLAMRDGPIDLREPVIELLRRLYRYLGIQRMRRR